MKRILYFGWVACASGFLLAESDPAFRTVEQSFRELPLEARRLTGPLFWLHGDTNETPARLETYLEKVAEGGNGSFTAESRPHRDWLGPGWYRDLEVCLQKAKALNLQMWIFDERWFPSQSVAGKVPAQEQAKQLQASRVEIEGPGTYTGDGFTGPDYLAAVAGRLAGDAVEGETLVDLAGQIHDGHLTWQIPNGRWRILKFTHRPAPGLSPQQSDVDGASQTGVDWFIRTVYQPHYDHFKADFGHTIQGFFYDEPATLGDWGTELNQVLKERGVDWKKAYVAYTSKLVGDDDIAARYQYMLAFAEAWGKTLYGGLTRWCHDHHVFSKGHFWEHAYFYYRPNLCAGDLMLLQKYSDMGGIDLVCGQMLPGQRPNDIYQMPKLGSSISHAYGKTNQVAMCEIFGDYGQSLTYPAMKWLTDQHQVRGINHLISHAFNPKAPYDSDCPPYFYNGGYEPRWPLYRIWTDYSSRLSLMLTGGKHVCPIAVLFSGNTHRVGKMTPPETITTRIQDALYDCDWIPFEVFENVATLSGKEIALYEERYQAVVVPCAEVITYPALLKARDFFRAGGTVIGYGLLPSRSGTLGKSHAEIAALCDEIWGASPVPGMNPCRQNAMGGRTFFFPEKPPFKAFAAALRADADVPPVLQVLQGETDQWLHALHRVKDGHDVFLICNQNLAGGARSFTFRCAAEGVPESWDAMRQELTALPFTRSGPRHVDLTLTLEPCESVLVVFQKEGRGLPMRRQPGDQPIRKIPVVRDAAPASPNAAGNQEPFRASHTYDSLMQALCSGYPGGAPATKTVSPVVGNPFAGHFEWEADAGHASARVYLEMDEIVPEEAASITINGRSAGGFIGRPFRLEVTPFLTNGLNTLKIEPFAPMNAWLTVWPNEGISKP